MTQRLTNISVKEVSLVDKPAIKREFLVMKADGADDDDNTNLHKEQGRMSKLTNAIKSLIGGATEEELESAAAAIAKAKSTDDDSDETEDDDDEKKKAAAKKTTAKSSDADVQDSDGDDKVAKADHEAAITKAREDGKAEAEKASAERIGTLEETVKGLEQTTADSTFRAHIIAKKWAGDVDKNVAKMTEMATHLPEALFKSWTDDQDAAAATVNEAVAKGGLFGEIGRTGDGDASVVMAAEEVAKAAADNPDDYEAVRKAAGSNYAEHQSAAEAAKPAQH